MANTIPSAVPPNFEKLKGRTNYSEWKFTLRYHLEDRELYNVCLDNANVDATTDRRARSAIVSSVSNAIIKEIQNCDTAKAMWDRLATLYEDNNPNRFITLNQEMFSTKFENCKDMAEYIETMRTIGIKMKTILPTYPDQAVAANILTNLPSYFRPLTMALENSVQELTTDFVCEKLLAEYAKMGAREQNAFPAKSSSEKLRFSGKCNICGKIGHKAKFCRLRKGRSNSNFSNNRDSKYDKQKQENYPKVREAWVNLSESEYCSPNESWIVDSGCDRHMTSCREFFVSYSKLSPCAVKTGGTVLQSVGEGSVTFSIKRQDKLVEITLQDVLYVPGLSANLISVKYLASKINIQAVFDARWCKLIKKDSGKVLATATCCGDNLYHLNTVQNTAMVNARCESINTWHKRLAHLNYSGLQTLKSISTGLEFYDEPEACVSCIKGKIHRQPFPKQKSTRSKEVLGLIHSDLCGPMEIDSIGGARYVLTFIDDKTRMTFVSFLKTKDEVFHKFVQFKVYIEKQTGKSIKAIRSDRGKEYVNQQMIEYFHKHGLHHQKTVAYSPEQNGIAERCNRTLVERARALLCQANLDSKLWAEAIYTAVYCKNRSPTIALNKKTPIEVWTGDKPDLSHMRIFGCRAFVHIPKCQRKKWDNKAKEMIFVGYSVESKGYRLMDPNTSAITEARDVIFIEDQYCAITTESTSTKTVVFYDEELLFPFVQQNASTSTNDAITTISSADDTVSSVPDSISNAQSVSNSIPLSPLLNSQPEEIRKSARVHRIPSYLSSYDLSDLKHHCNISTALDLNEFDNHTDVPSCYQEAITSVDSQKWKGAIVEELNSHKKNHTWDIVSLPTGYKPIKCKWVFKVKQNSDGTSERYKARLVAKGCSQREGIDYTETFSPVVRYDTLRVLIALATLYNWEIDHVDAVVAFLQGNIDEEIYMECPEGLEVSKERGDKMVCRLQKAIYGLKQSGRAWYTKLDEGLKSLGLICADFDCCVYYNIKSCDILIIAVYVDDLLIFSSSAILKDELKEKLFNNFDIKDLGELQYCLGIEIQRDRTKGITTLSQKGYIESVLRKYNMHDSKPVNTPSDCNQKLTKSSNQETDNLSHLYQSAVGSLLYAAKATRPDIAHVVSVLCQYCSNPSKVHWTAAKRVFRYLHGTLDLKLTFSRDESEEIVGYCDSDFAGCLDDRKSTSGFVYTLAGGAITWQSKKQSTVASSTVEAEYIALASATKEAIWLRKFLTELNFPSNSQPIKIYCDNKGAIDLTKNSLFHARTKHIDIVHHVSRNASKMKQIEVLKIGTEAMVADSLTKAVPHQKFLYCSNNMGLK